MSNVIQFARSEPVTMNDAKEEGVQRLPYSFDITQVGENVLIDACVPAPVALKIAQLILESAEASEAEPKAGKRRSRKAVA